MTPEAQRIAIAEACRISQIRTSGRWEVTDPPENPRILVGMNQSRIVAVPDYLNDLNAMHEAEKIFVTHGNPHRVAYKHALMDVAGADDWSLIHATAAQRAEAFLRTLGLWKDSPHAE